MKRTIHSFLKPALMIALAVTTLPVFAESDQDEKRGRDESRDLPSHAQVLAALKSVVAGGGNGGFALNMWATVVNRDGYRLATLI